MTYAIGAAPIGAPGCPELAFWTPSIESVRMVSTESRSRSGVTVVIGVGSEGGRSGRWSSGRRGRAGRPSYRLRRVTQPSGTRGVATRRYHRGMPRLVSPRPLPRPGRPGRPSRPGRPHRPGRPGRRGTGRSPRIVVLGDLIVDVVVAPSKPIELGTDVPGRVAFIAGGSATNTA